MSNSKQYWDILESLLFPVMGAPATGKQSDSERRQINVDLLQKAFQLGPKETLKELINEIQLPHLLSHLEQLVNDLQPELLYSIYALLLLHRIRANNDFNSDSTENLISERHKSLLIACMEDINEFGLKANLHSSFYGSKTSIFQRHSKQAPDFFKTELLFHALAPFIFIQPLQIGQKYADIILSFMAAAYSLIFASESKEHPLDPAQSNAINMFLQKIWTSISKKTYFRNLFLLFAMVPAQQKKRLHISMLAKLRSSGGFVALLLSMLETQKDDPRPIAEVVANIVAQPSYTPKTQQSLIEQILEFLKACLNNKELMSHMGVGLLSLRKLYDQNAANKEQISLWLRAEVAALIAVKPENITAMEWSQFVDLCSLLFHMFCTSSIECLPSNLLLIYTPLLISCYQQVHLHKQHEILRHHLSSLILRILNNRQTEEFAAVMEYLAKQSYPSDWIDLHSHITIEENPLNSLELRIVQKDVARQCNIFRFESHICTVAQILKESSFNLLAFQTFLSLFRLLPSLELENLEEPTMLKANSLLSDEELEDKIFANITMKYHSRMGVIKSLELLLQHKPLKALMQENITQILQVLQQILSNLCRSANNEANTSVITILLVLIREIVAVTSAANKDNANDSLAEALKNLEAKVTDKNLKYQIMTLRQQIQKEMLWDDDLKSSECAFEEARCLLEANESYVQVEGIEKLIKLINSKDAFVISNVHVVTALALNSLKSSESYTFLNCVRLFAALVNVNASEVMDILSEEYLNDAAALDYRLVVGEAMLRVCRELGPMCYKYKALLLNCFMNGCRSSCDEFRFSAFSNLAQMCRILTYQIHQFFEELLHLIDCELTSGKYLPAQRAAVMVLSDLLAGMDNLFDYQEMLLPIYRLLKHLASSQTADEKIRLHAAIGLDNLSMKCKELFKSVTEAPLQKEIKILGIETKPKRNLKDHILYM